MFHCHILQHEDRGMMGQFVVVEPGPRPRRAMNGVVATLSGIVAAVLELRSTSGSPVSVPERGELASEAWARRASCGAPALRYRIRGFT
jgi:hypothetical protein